MEVDIEKWKKARSRMFINMCVVAFTFGLSLTAYYPTEYYYLKDFMKLKNAKFLYGLSWAFLCGSGVVSSLIGSYYADATKNIRTIFIVTNIANIIGNILYALYYSPYLVLGGQLLVGTAGARLVALVSEISRVYKPSEVTTKISLTAIFSSIGGVLGPCSAFAFYNLNINLGEWNLNIGNMNGVFMALLYAFQLLLNLFTLENVSKMYTLKQSFEEKILLADGHSYLSKDKENYLDKLTFKEKYIYALKKLFRSKHVIFLFLTSFYVTYVRSSITLMQPIVTEKYLNWKQVDLATFMIIVTCGGVIPTALLLAAISKYVNDFFLFIFTILSLLIALLFMGSLPFISGNYLALSCTVYASGFAFSISSAGSQILLRSMLAKFVPENIQTVTEAIRNSLFESAFMFAGLLAKLPITYLTQSMFAFALVLCGFLAWFIVEEKTFVNIKEISLIDNKNKSIIESKCFDDDHE